MTAPTTGTATPAGARGSRPAAAPGVLAGRTAVVTGAGRGLGRIFAAALADAGAAVVLTGRDPTALGAAAGELRARGARSLAVPGDLTVPGTTARVAAEALEAFGGIDLLVNNAGAAGPLGPLWQTDAEDWRQTLEVNVLGTADACRAVLPAMTAARGGRIVNVVSAAGRHRWPYASAYSVSKAAVIKLTENLAHELRGHGVSVFSFHPGLLDVGITRTHLERGVTGDLWTDRIGEWLRAERAAGRFTPPDAAARALLLLACGAADDMSGAYLTTDDLLHRGGSPEGDRS